MVVIVYIKSALTSKLRSYFECFNDGNTKFIDVESSDYDFNQFDSIVNSLDTDNERAHVVIGYDSNQSSQYLRYLKRTSNSKLITILVSTFASWGGKVGNARTKSFETRTPLPGASKQYRTENQFWQLSKESRLPLMILGVGLIYGPTSTDFDEIFNGFWSMKPISMPMYIRKNFIPMIHQQDLCIKISSLLESDGLLTKPTFVGCCDDNNVPIGDLLDKLSIMLNNQRVQFKDIESYSNNWSQEWKTNVLMDDSPTTSKHSLLDDTSEIWQNYLTRNQQDKRTVVVIGGPRFGKTTLSKQLSEQLSIKYLSVPEAIRFIVDWSQSQSSNLNSVVSLPWTSDGINQLISEVVDILRNKLSDGKKTKKSEESQAIDLQGIDLSPSFFKNFPLPLLRRCVQATIDNDLNYRRMGYILDVSSYGIINTTEELLEMTTVVPNVIVEIQIDSAIAIRRISQRMGSGLESPSARTIKENQAVVKSLDQQITAYKSKLVAIDSNNNLDVSQSRRFSHPIVINIQSQPELQTTIIRIEQDLDPNDAIAIILERLSSSGNTNSNSEILPSPSIEELPSQCLTNTATSSNHPLHEMSNNAILKQSLIQLEEYIVANVLPPVAEGMIAIRREKPEDPIKFLYEYLYKAANQVEQTAEQEAYQRFCQLLADGK